MRTLLVLLALVVAPAAALACDEADFPSRYEIFDGADTVVVGKPKVAPKFGFGGPTTFEVDTVIKGKAGNTITIPKAESDCDAGFRVGARTLVFLKGGAVHRGYRGAIIIGSEPWIDRMQQWSAAVDDTARAGVIANAISDGKEVGIDAVVALVNMKQLVAALTNDHIATIAGAWPKLHSGLRGMLRELKNPALQKALEKASRQRPKTKPM